MRSLILILCLFCGTFPCGRTEDVGESLFVTPYIEKGQIDEVQQLAKVTLNDAENITSYAGLFTVNKTFNSNLFFWYFVSEVDPKNAPVLLWLNGGPGTSSLMGLFDEHGPFYVDDQLKLKFRQYYWTKNHHVIFVDNPVGVGYSFTRALKGYARNTKSAAENVYAALVQFFEMFPQLKQNDFYLTGESYAGKYIPAISDIILNCGQIQNFKGVAIGNGLVDPVVQLRGFGKYLYQQGFVDVQQKEEFEMRENQCVEAIKNRNVGRALKYCLSIIHPFHNHTLFYKFTGYKYTYNILEDWKPVTTVQGREQFVQLAHVRRAIHVGNLKRSDYKMLGLVQLFLGASQMDSEKQHVERLLNESYPVLLYSGQLDIQIPYITMVNYIKQLQFPQSDLYKTARRNIWILDDHVAGYVKRAGSLIEVMVIGAGHAVPAEQPKRAFDLITRFTRGNYSD